MNFFARLWLALVCLFKITFDRAFAERVQALRAPALPPVQPLQDRPTLPAKPLAIKADQLAKAEQALHLLAILQREARLIDFVQEDIAAFQDAQIGAAARTVHAGCRKALGQVFTFAPIRPETEGTPLTVPAGFDPGAIRLTGNVTGNPPFQGTLRHHGWRVTDVRLPAASGDGTVLAPAEVELP